MGKLIDADWLKAQWSEPTDWMDGDQVLHHYTWFKMMLELAPTVDAVPVRHGRWETDGMMMDDGEYLMTRCTACGEAYEYGYNMPFCPKCGARMDGTQ